MGRRVGVNAVITWLLFAGCHCPADPHLPPHISAGPGAAWAEGWAPRLPVPGDLQLPAAFQVRDVHAALLRLCVLLCSGARDQAIRWSPLLSSPCASANTTPTTISLALSLSIHDGFSLGHHLSSWPATRGCVPSPQVGSVSLWRSRDLLASPRSLCSPVLKTVMCLLTWC